MEHANSWRLPYSPRVEEKPLLPSKITHARTCKGGTKTPPVVPSFQFLTRSICTRQYDTEAIKVNATRHALLAACPRCTPGIYPSYQLVHRPCIAIGLSQQCDARCLRVRNPRTVGEDISFSPRKRLEKQVQPRLGWLHDGLLSHGRRQAQPQPVHSIRGK